MFFTPTQISKGNHKTTRAVSVGSNICLLLGKHTLPGIYDGDVDAGSDVGGDGGHSGGGGDVAGDVNDDGSGVKNFGG